jgi:DNA-binding CsgD family transcriptional regulator
MLKSLPLEDVKAIVRMLADIAIHQGSIGEKRKALLCNLAALVKSDAWFWVHSGGAARDNTPMMFSMVDGGWRDEHQRGMILQSHYTPGAAVINEHFQIHAAGMRHVTRTRRDVVSDEIWYACDFYKNHWLPAHVEDFLFDVYPIGDGVISGIALHRERGKALFSDRERCLVHLLTSQIDWLHRAGTDVPAAGKVGALTIRQRAVMLLLLQGEGRKQIARKLSISEHTVGDHLKAIHTHFSVSSRGELLAQFISGGSK